MRTHKPCQALIQTGRPIQFVLSWSLDHNYVSYWKQYTNGWRIDTDVECYCNSIVTWNNSLKQRFTDVVPWIADAGPGGWNNLDSLDVGVGSMDGLSNDERQTYMTLWAIEAAPLYNGDDLTKLDSYGLSLLTNDEVIAVDQAGIPAKSVAQSSNQQVWYALNNDGSYTVALFNLDSTPATVTANWSDLGFLGRANVRDLWSHNVLGQFTNSFSASLPVHGSKLLNVKPDHSTPIDDLLHRWGCREAGVSLLQWRIRDVAGFPRKRQLESGADDAGIGSTESWEQYH